MTKLTRFTLILVLLITAAGCASTPTIESDDPFIASILNYEASLPEGHSDTTNQVFKLSSDIREKVREDFGNRGRHRSALDLAQWLMSADGHNLVYDLNANLTPNQAFEQRRGNCLSFTLLLVELASELDINLKVNQVDLPDMWGQGEHNNLIFYRHVNAIFKTTRGTQIFDLAMEEYKPGFPQKEISRREATALLFSNLGIENLKKNKIDTAIHYLSLSASVFPTNPDMWINLGATYKHLGQLDLAEKIYLQAFSISDRNNLAASNLERLYRQQERHSLADRYQKLAARMRARNPYIHFQKAEAAFKQKDYRSASKSIKRAIRLHDLDPEFFELSSRIKQVNNKYISALKDLEKAHNLSTTGEERNRYVDKVKMVAARFKAIQEQRADRDARRAGHRQIELIDYNTRR